MQLRLDWPPGQPCKLKRWKTWLVCTCRAPRSCSSHPLESLFPDLVQLNSFLKKKPVTIYEDEACDEAFESLSRMFGSASQKQDLPQNDMPDICHDYFQAFDRLVKYHHVKRLLAEAVLSFVDCEISPTLGTQWDVEASIMINRQSFNLCDSHLPEEAIQKFASYTPLFSDILAYLQQLLTRSLNAFPSTFQRLLSLTGVDGFIDSTDPLPDLSK
jgi:hypothetical protein